MIDMIGKIIALLLIGVVVISFTGYNATPFYQDYVKIRDITQPIQDHMMETGLNYTAQLNLGHKLSNYMETQLK